jgi:hypothetical protein
MTTIADAFQLPLERENVYQPSAGPKAAPKWPPEKNPGAEDRVIGTVSGRSRLNGCHGLAPALNPLG